MKLVLSLAIALSAFSQVNSLSKEQLLEYTKSNPFERFPDGRPKVPDALLEKLRAMSAEEVLSIVRKGYANQYADGFRIRFLEAGQGFGFTYPARSPHARAWYERNAPAFLRLDHVFYRGNLQARSARVGPSGESDHFSVVVELQRPG